MPKETKIRVGKGKSVLVVGSDGEWHKVFYEIEATLDEEDPAALERTLNLAHKARFSIENMLNQWLQEEPVEPEAKLNPAELDALPWTTYRTKKPAEPGHSGWIRNPLSPKFSNFNDPTATKLAKALESGKLELGEYIYQLTGKEKQFIGRKPIKPSQAEPKKPPDNSGNDEARPP